MAEGYVVKLLDNNGTIAPRWVTIEGGRGFGPREGATCFQIMRRHIRKRKYGRRCRRKCSPS
jgi:hypothetical protein